MRAFYFVVVPVGYLHSLLQQKGAVGRQADGTRPWAPGVGAGGHLPVPCDLEGFDSHSGLHKLIFSSSYAL